MIFLSAASIHFHRILNCINTATREYNCSSFRRCQMTQSVSGTCKRFHWNAKNSPWYLWCYWSSSRLQTSVFRCNPQDSQLGVLLKPPRNTHECFMIFMNTRKVIMEAKILSHLQMQRGKLFCHLSDWWHKKERKKWSLTITNCFISLHRIENVLFKNISVQ